MSRGIRRCRVQGHGTGVDCPECYVKHCAMHASYNKAYSALNSFRLLAEDNIAGDIHGHPFPVHNLLYIPQLCNTFKHNLPIGIRSASGFLQQGIVKGDPFPIPLPPNHLLYNVATGCQGAAHYYTLSYFDHNPHTTRGPGFYAISLYLRKVPLSGPATLLCATASTFIILLYLLIFPPLILFILTLYLYFKIK